MEKFYQIAGIDISLKTLNGYFSENIDFLEQFRTNDALDPHRYQFAFLKNLDPPRGNCVLQETAYRIYVDDNTEYRYLGNVQGTWKNAYLRGMHAGKKHEIQLRADRCTDGLGAKTILNALTMEHLLTVNNGVVLHASYVAWNGHAILFTAPSGTGKSTQADLWVTHRNAELINGDRVGIRVTDDAVLACGIPFAGSSGVCKNVTLPIAAIVYLAQAPRTTIQKLSGIRAFCRIWEGCSINTWNAEDVVCASETVKNIIERVPVYYMPCTPDKSAVTMLEHTLGE